jgi:hypothetical protein
VKQVCVRRAPRDGARRAGGQGAQPDELARGVRLTGRAATAAKTSDEDRMSPSSYSDVFAISHEREYEEHIQAGDVVRSGPNLFPYFEVIAVDGDKAWVRDVQTGADHLTLLSRCRRIMPESQAVAA